MPAREGKSYPGCVEAFQDDLSSWAGKLRVPAPVREDSKERRNARWHTTLLAKSSVLHLGSGWRRKGAASGYGEYQFCGRRMSGGA